MRISRRKAVLTAIVLTVVLFAAVFVSFSFYGEKRLVKIYLNNKCVYEKNLDDVSTPLKISVGNGNTVLIENDGVSMAEADCPDKLCVKQGKIKRGTLPIVCLPNRVVVRLCDGE